MSEQKGGGEKNVILTNHNPEFNPIPKERIEAARPQVLASAKLGCTDKEIASIIQMGECTVKERFRAELDKGRSSLAGGLRKAQLETAITEKNPAMLIWLGKCYLGQREPKQDYEVSGGLVIEKKIFHPNAAED